MRAALFAYWLRHLPSDWVTGVEGGTGKPDGGIGKPDGSVIQIGDTITVSGSVSWLPLDTQCSGTHTLDATSVS